MIRILERVVIMARKGYPAEFRRRALDLVAAGKPVAEVARLLEISDQSIYSWRRQERIDRGEVPGLSSMEREELRAAKRRIRELETEVAVHALSDLRHLMAALAMDMKSRQATHRREHLGVSIRSHPPACPASSRRRTRTAGLRSC